MVNIESCIEAKKPVDSSIIKVIGVGGAGCNAVRHMLEVGIEGVNYVICNTDRQALEDNPVELKIQLGRTLTEGLGAGNDPERGRASAIEALDEIKAMLAGARMTFITAGMGGGTGTGAAPVIAKTSKDMDILTIGIVAIPYANEGEPRIRQAIKGIEELGKCVDSLLVINSERLREMYGNQPIRKALNNANEVLAIAAKGIAEMISIHGIVNVDFADVKTAMADSGVSVMGTATAGGENRAIEAVKAALNSPILNNNDIHGSKYVLVNMFSSDEHEMTQDEQGTITDYLRELTGHTKNETLIWGCGIDNTLEDKIRVTVVATGFANDCFSIKTKRNSNDVVNMVMAKDGTVETTDAADIEDEGRAEPIDLPVNPDEDKKIDILYRGKSEKREVKKYSTADLSDPVIIPLEKLASEEVISHIENVPAFERRAGA